MVEPAPPRRGRRLRRGLAALALLVVVLIAAFPWALGTAPARRWMLARANRALAPGSVRFEAIRLSWLGPTHLTNVALIDPRGKPVIAAPRASWDRNLFRILFDRHGPGTLAIDGAALDFELRDHGSLDLIDALRPILVPNPKRDFRLRISNGSLRFRSPVLDGPLTADRAILDLHVPTALRPTIWRLILGDPTGPGPSLDISGRSARVRSRAEVPPDLEVAVSGQDWPLAVSFRGAAARGRYQGQTSVRRVAGHWALSGDATLLELDASGPALAGDRLQLDRVGGTWDVSETGAGWTVERLDLRSPLATLKATGRIPAAPGAPGRIEGEIDLPALARLLPRTLHLREGLTLDRGRAILLMEARSEPNRTAWDVSARVSDLLAHHGDRAITLREPATLSARLVGQARGIQVDHFGLTTAFLAITGRGDVDRGIAVTGTVDLGGFRRQAQDVIDLGAVELDGKGTMAAEYRRAGERFDGHLDLDLRSLRLAGLATGPIRREALHLDARLDGPADLSGLPQGWTSARLALKDGELTGALEARRGDLVTLTADARVPLLLGGRESHANGHLLSRWRGDLLEFDEVRASLAPVERGTPPIAMAARGQYDSASGVLSLSPVPAAEPGAVALAAEGVRVSGLGGSLHVDASLAGNLGPLSAALKPWIESMPDGLAGPWTLRATARSGDGGMRVGGKVEAPGAFWGHAEDGGRRALPPLSLTWQTIRPADADRLDVLELVLTGGYATLELSGRVDDLAGRRLADLRGTVTPDWEKLNALLAERVEPGAVAKGKARPAHLKGPLSGGSADDVLRGLDAEAGIDLLRAEFFGMRVGPAAIVARSRDQGIAFDPIQTTLNGGSLRLMPAVVRDRSGGWVLRLGAGSKIEDAEINDEVSRRVLAFVAPVLDAATRARGKVSVDVERAEFPIGGDGARRAVVEGHVVFRDAEFAPGPLAEDLLHLVGRADVPTMKLDEPVVLSISDGRVHQRGMALPVGKVARIELDGSVGFDRTLDLRAALPITPQMLGNNPLLGELAAGARVVVPIGGTLSKPKVDRDAFNLALKDLGKDLLQRGLTRGAAGLLMQLTRPRGEGPADPPKPSPEERRAVRERRKAARQERRAERRDRLP